MPLSLRALWTAAREFSPSNNVIRRRSYSDNKKYSHSIRLPKSKFTLRNDPSKDPVLKHRTEAHLNRWQWANADGPLFVLHDGPPYANGDLHMGHALNKILKDIINRYHVSLGHRVHYIPGWDCHGLPIENKVLKTLGKESNELAPSDIRVAADKYARQQVSSQMVQFSEFGIMTDWSENRTYRTLDKDYEITQLRIFQQMVGQGMIYRDFRPVYYSPSSRSALAEAELEYHDKHTSHTTYITFELDLEGPTMSPALRSLVTGRSKVYLMSWTTTPWTLTANMGIAVGPDLEYIAATTEQDPSRPLYIFVKDRERDISRMFDSNVTVTPVSVIKGSDLVGATYHPIFHTLLSPTERSRLPSRTLPVVPGAHVTPDTGTGLVHCAPAHGPEDYALFKSLGLLGSSDSSSMLCHVDLEARFTEQVQDVVGAKAAAELVGSSILGEGVQVVIGLLRQAGALVKVQTLQHRYPYDWKTDEPVVVMPTSQWFANLDGIKDNAIEALKDVTFYPPQSRNRLESFIRSRSEWCISRQRVWGVPIPYLTHLPSGRTVLTRESLEHIISVLREKGTAYWLDGPVSAFVSHALRRWAAGKLLDASTEETDEETDEEVERTWRKGTDTMDVWFDSGTSWAMLVPHMKRKPEMQDAGAERRFYADICLEGSDQHRGWFQSQLLTSVATSTSSSTTANGKEMSASPYGTLITHGMVLDEAGKKMSKSLGNVISPMTIIHGGEDKQKDPQYGTEVLRLWAASVEFAKDMSIGPTILMQCAEVLFKLRNIVKFILGNMRDHRPEKRVDRSELGLVERYIMHELYKVEQAALEGYAKFDFPRVVTTLSNFIRFPVSSLYFDITKDCLYLNALDSPERIAVVTVFEKILDTITHIIAPILPHFAEEIHDRLDRPNPVRPEGLSFFSKKWIPLGAEWQDAEAEKDMDVLLALRKDVNMMLEILRRDPEKKLRSSLEANVKLIVPADHALTPLLTREAHILSSLLLVSDVSIVHKDIEYTSRWQGIRTASLAGHADMKIVITPAVLEKCPRCWTFTREKDEALCHRCSDVVENALVVPAST